MSVSSRVIVRGFAGLAALVVTGSLAVTAVAQRAPAPVREVQGSDGTLYIVQGTNSWTLVPDQISDADVAALNPGGEIDGTFPNELFVVQAPALPPVAAPPAPLAPQAQIRVDVNKELTPVSNANATCSGVEANASKLVVSLGSVDRPADGRTAWHVGVLNHASVSFSFRGSTDTDPTYRAFAYVLASDGTKYDAFAIEDGTVAVEEKKALDVISQQTIPAGAYRLFFVVGEMIFNSTPFSSVCRGLAWSSTPISLP
jgi:hypothetical protein